MDIRKFASHLVLEWQNETRLHPPKAIQSPLQFPFLIVRAKSRIRQTKGGQRLIQQHVDLSARGLHPEPIDPWRMREEFVALKRDESKLLAFLDKYGLWTREKLADVDDFWDFQETLRDMLLCGKQLRGQLLSRSAFGKLPGLLARKLTIDFEYDKGVPRFVVRTLGCLDAIIASLQIDSVLGTPSRKCLRDDCPVVFRETRRNRKYCGESCRHLEVMRNRRKTKREKMSRIRTQRRSAPPS